jgi:hypothetical protein
MQEAQRLVQFENSIMVPKEILSLYNINLYSYVNYINTLELMIESSSADLTKNYASYIDSQNKIQDMIKDDGSNPSLDTLNKLIQYQMKLKFDSYLIENKINNLELIYNKIDSLRNILDNYCQRTSARQDPKDFSLNTQNNYFNIPLHSNYTSYTAEESFAKDPHAAAVGWLTFSGLSIAGIAAYCIYMNAALSEVIGISGTSITFSGPAVPIVLAAAILAIGAVDWYTENENERKRVEAEERTKELRSEMFAASQWYETNSVFHQPETFKKISLDLCQNQKTWKMEILYDDFDSETQAKLDLGKCFMKDIGGNASNTTFKKVCDVDVENQFDKTTKGLKTYFTAFDIIDYPKRIQSLKDEIDQNEFYVSSLIEQYEFILIEKYSKNIVQLTQQKSISDNLISEGINAYNLEIKDKLHQKFVSDYISNMFDCSRLEFAIKKDLKNLESMASAISYKYKDDLNEKHSFFTADLPLAVTRYRTTYISNVDACKLGNSRSIYLLNDSKTKDKIYDIKVPIHFLYKDNVTDYSFSFVLENSDYLEYLENGIFSFGLIGHFNLRKKENSKDATVAANISALELDKISSALYHQSNLVMPKPPVNLIFKNMHSGENDSIQFNRSGNNLISSSIDEDLNLDIDNLYVELNHSLNPLNFITYLNLDARINSLKQLNQFDFKKFNNSLTKFNSLKSKFFYDEIFIVDKNFNRSPILFYSNSTSLEGQALREITNLCIANGFCTSQDSLLSYLVLIDHYSPNSIFNLYDKFIDYFDDKSPNRLSDLNIFFKQELLKSESFQDGKTKILNKKLFSRYELKEESKTLAQKYAIKFDKYSDFIFLLFKMQ